MPRKSKAAAANAPKLIADDAADANLDPTGEKTGKVNKKTWTEKVTKDLATYARSRNIRDEAVIEALIAGILADLTATGHVGNTMKAHEKMAHEVLMYFEKNPQKAQLPKCAKDVAPEVEKWLRDHYGFDKNTAQMLMRRSNVGMFNIELVAWISNVHSQAEQMAFNNSGTYRFHWFNNESSIAFLNRFHKMCDERAIPYGARSRFITEAIQKSSIFGYEGTLQDLEALLKPKFEAVPLKTAQDSVHTESAATENVPDSDNLDDWFPRSAKPVELDEETIARAKTRRNWASFWLRVGDEWNLHEVPVEDSQRKVVHEIVGVESLTEVGDDVSDADLMAMIKKGLDARYKLKPTRMEQKPMTDNTLNAEQWKAWKEANFPNIEFDDIVRYLAAAVDYPMTRLGQWKGDLHEAGEIVTTALSVPEVSNTQTGEDDTQPAPPLNLDFTMVSQPVRVAPSARGNLIVKGYRFWFELGVGGTMEMVKSLIDEILKDKDLIDPGCMVNPQIPVTDSSKLPNQPPHPVTAANAGITPSNPNAHTENCYAIIRTMDNKGEKIVYNLLFKLANGDDPQSPIQVSTPRAKETLESTLAAAGVSPESLPMGKRVDMNIWFERVKNDKGFWDYLRFVILPDSVNA